MTDLNNWQDAVKLLSEEIRASGEPLGVIARETGKNVHTISKVYYREYSRSPSALTLFVLFNYFGYRVTVQRIRNVVQLRGRA